MQPRKDLDRIPPVSINRFATYHRILSWLEDSGVMTVSSEGLAEFAGVTSANVRRDLSRLGAFGTRGSGYEVAILRQKIGESLGVGGDRPVCIAGVGNLGKALLTYPGLSRGGFRICALYDADPAKVGTDAAGHRIEHIDNLPEANRKDPAVIAVITSPAMVAQDIAGKLYSVGVREILNFAPVHLTLPSDAVIRNLDVGMELLVLSFHETRRNANRNANSNANRSG